MSLTVAVGVEQLQVVQLVRATQRPLDPVVDLPLLAFLQELTAATTASSLLAVQAPYLHPSYQTGLHLLVQPFLVILLPFRVVWVGVAAYLHVPPDAHPCRRLQADRP